LGGTGVTIVLILIRMLQHLEIGRYGESVSEIDPTWAILAGLFLAAFFGWRRSTPLENIWQRGVIGVLSAVGAFILAVLAVPVWHFFQFTGLILLAGLCLMLGLAGNRWAVRGGNPT